MVGGDYLERGVRAMAPGGRLAIIALRKGAKVEFDFSAVQAKVPSSRIRADAAVGVEKARLVAAVRKASGRRSRRGASGRWSIAHLHCAKRRRRTLHGFRGARRQNPVTPG